MVSDLGYTLYMTSNRTFNPRHTYAKTVGSFIGRLATPIFQSHGFVSASVLLDWPQIVGPEFARFCEVEKLTFPYKQRQNGRLTVRASSAMAVAITYQEPLILEKINSYFGYQAVSKLVILQGPLRHKPEVKLEKKETPVPAEVMAQITEQVANIEDEVLRQSLVNLGVGVYKKNAIKIPN